MALEGAGRPKRPLKLVQFVRSFHVGGTEVQALELMRGLPARYQLQVCVLQADGPLLQAVRSLGYEPEAFPLHGSLAQANTALQVGRLASWLRRQQVELVHVHDFYATSLAVPACRLTGVKVIVGRLDLAHWHSRTRRALHAQLTRLADHVVVNAEAIRAQLLAEEHLPAGQVSVIPNGLDLARFDARVADGLKAPLPPTRGEPVVLHVANMHHPVKRQEDLLQALSLLRSNGVRLHAFLVGDGERRAALERLSAQLGLQGWAHFLGLRADVPALYEHATFGVLCSSAEGMSNAVMEGMAAARAMVVTRVGGNAELVVDGQRGLLVPPHQPAQLAAAFRRLLVDPALARQLGAEARRFVERSLSLEQLVARHDHLYQHVAQGEAAPALRWAQEPAG